MNFSIGNVASENNIIKMLVHDLSYLYDNSFNLTTEDFTLQRNKLLFIALVNAAEKGVQTFTVSDFIKELDQYGVEYQQYINKDLITVLDGDSAYDKSLFKEDVNRVKKCTLLRDLTKAGFDIQEYYSSDFPTTVDLNDYEIEDILNKYKAKLNEIEDRNISIRKKTSQKANEGLRELIQKFKLEPDIGAFLDGDIYNYAVRGARYGKYYINSGGSGTGKTRSMVGEACGLAFPYLDRAGKIIIRDEYHPVLYIPTEQTIEEIQTMVVSYVSGVPEKRILEGRLTDEDQERIDIAIQIIDLFSDNFRIEWIPEPTLALIRTKIAAYVYKYNIHYIFYDYIFTSPNVLSEFKGSGIREDVILMMMSNTLKELAINHNVFIKTGTQVNAESDKKLVRDESCIRGSRAIVDKADVGCISTRITPEERDKIQGILDQLAFEKEPNIVMDIYKNRRGDLTKVKIYRYFDYGTCRMSDLFMTDSEFNPINDFTIFKRETKKLNNIKELEQYVELQND